MEKLVRPHISKEKNQQKMRKDAILKGIFRIAAVISGGAIAVIVLFVFLRGVQPFLPGYANGQVNFIDFLFGTTWRQDQGIYGAGFIIINTLITSFGALIISFPISVLTALFIVKIAPKWLAKIMTPSWKCSRAFLRLSTVSSLPVPSRRWSWRWLAHLA